MKIRQVVSKAAAAAAPPLTSQVHMAPVHRQDMLFSLGLQPFIMGIGHLAPSIGAARAVLGYWYLDWPLLIAACASTAYMDAYDKFRDIPKASRPPTLRYYAWFGLLLIAAVVASSVMGLTTSFRLYRWLLLGIVWGKPLIPVYSFQQCKMTFVKPKVLLAFGKSAVVGLAMADVDGDMGAYRACIVAKGVCRRVGGDVYWRSWALAFVYNWVRETLYDARDIEEDVLEGVPTLPVTLGRRNTLILTTLVTFFAEQLIAGRGLWEFPGMESVLRQLFAMVGCLLAMKQPRENQTAWAFVGLFGLVPAMWGQSRL